MKPIAYLVLGVCLSLTGFFGYSLFTQTSSAQKAARLQWEYASITHIYSFNTYKDRVNRIYGMALVCYVQANGCRELEIKHELDYGTFLQQTGEAESPQTRKYASQKATEIAFQKALTQLGNEGWEVVGEPYLDFSTVEIDAYNNAQIKSELFERQSTKAVYFKRLKTQ